MSSAKGKLARLLGTFFLRRAVVERAEDVGGFRHVLLRGDFPRPLPGAKVQLLLPSDDMRTYTPIAAPEGMALLGWKHAGGPGARWISEVEEGAEVRFVGPQRSLELREGPAVIVGDETSVAVAASFARARPGKVRAVLEAGSVADVREAASAVGLEEVVVPRGDTGALVEAVVSARASAPGAALALTGGSALVVAARKALRERGIQDVKTKTYWIPGKRGLD